MTENQNRPAFNRVLDSGGTLKLPNTPADKGLADSINDYLTKFPYKIEITIGRTYTKEFKEFNVWCESTLGVKYKDWFLASNGGPSNSSYTLYLKDSKKSVFLALKFSESIDKAILIK